jgi:hypothetical protein
MNRVEEYLAGHEMDTWEIRWNDKRLQRLFDRYNRRFFDSRLVGWTVGCGQSDRAVCRRRPGSPFAGYCADWTKRISMDIWPSWSDRKVRSTLLHEMAHASSGDGFHYHSGPWAKEMKRIRRLGATTHCPHRFIRRVDREIRLEIEEIRLQMRDEKPIRP